MAPDAALYLQWQGSDITTDAVPHFLKRLGDR